MSRYEEKLEWAIADFVAPAAQDVDAGANFPRKAITALGEAGILGLTVSPPYGTGGTLREAADVVQRLAAVCSSTAMVTLMHYAAVAAIDKHGPVDVRAAIGAGTHLTTLAFSEVGSRSHFWAPMGTARPQYGDIRLDGRKSWVTSAGEADSYVWSSRPLAADGPMTLWLVDADAEGLSEPGAFDGLGLRGNASKPLDASNVVIAPDRALGADGAGLDIALAEVLPWFLVLSAAFSVGLMEAVTTETGAHLTATRLEHLDQRLVDQPLARVDHARMRITTDQASALLDCTLTALEEGREEAMLKVLEVKASAGEAAIVVTELAMKLCGGAAFRRELGIERRFRDARAARVMAPTTDALLDFVGRAINGMPLL